jgi:tetratricopeptide (TPR) repeat protein
MRIWLSIIALFISLSVVEIILRIQENRHSYLSDEQLMAQTLEALPSQIKEKNIDANSFNIYYIGESTMVGEPFSNSIPTLVEQSIGTTLSNKPIRWINLGMAGMDSHYWGPLAIHILENTTLYHPSLLVLYGGHNEFLKFHSGWGFDSSFIYAKQLNWLTSHLRLARISAQALGLYKLEIDDRAFFDMPIVSSEVKEEVLRNFENQLLLIAQKAQEKNIPLIVSTAAGNVSEFHPNRSVCDIDASSQAQFIETMEQAAAYYQNGLYSEAILSFKKAQTLCPTFSFLSFRMGQTYEAMGQFEEAWNFYQEALDFDGMPIRATSRQNDAIRKLSMYPTTYVVDSVAALRKVSANGLIGFNTMIDGHHPNLHGYITIAEAVSSTILTLTGSTMTPTRITLPQAETLLMPDAYYAYDAYATRGLWFLRLATWTHEPSFLLDKAREYLEKANRLSPTNPRGYVLLSAVEYLEGNISQGDAYIQRAQNIDYKETLILTSQPWFFQIKKRAAIKHVSTVSPSPTTKESGK